MARKKKKSKESDNKVVKQGCAAYLYELAILTGKDTSLRSDTRSCSLDSNFQVATLHLKLVSERLGRDERSMLIPFRTSCVLHSGLVQRVPKQLYGDT